MRKMSHAPSLSCEENIKTLEPRNSPYWNILVFCRHLGLQKLPTGKLFWMARIRTSDGKYRQVRLGPHISWDSSGIDYEQALERANVFLTYISASLCLMAWKEPIGRPNA